MPLLYKDISSAYFGKLVWYTCLRQKISKCTNVRLGQADKLHRWLQSAVNLSVVADSAVICHSMLSSVSSSVICQSILSSVSPCCHLSVHAVICKSWIAFGWKGRSEHGNTFYSENKGTIAGRQMGKCGCYVSCIFLIFLFNGMFSPQLSGYMP